MNTNTVEILLAEDNPVDVELTREAFASVSLDSNLHVCRDGVEALDFLYGRVQFDGAVRPDVILLDLNMPRLSGLEVLEAIASDENLRSIPVLVLSTSDDSEVINRCYQLNANCYLVKPVDLDQFFNVIEAITAFWLSIARLPTMNEKRITPSYQKFGTPIENPRKSGTPIIQVREF